MFKKSLIATALVLLSLGVMANKCDVDVNPPAAQSGTVNQQ